MKLIFLVLVSLIPSLLTAQKVTPLFSAGIDYRTWPIDIEDVTDNTTPFEQGLPSDDTKFWKTWSMYGAYGLSFKKNWTLFASVYGRYNHLHRTEGINYANYPVNYNVNTKKSFKLDAIVEVEKKLRLKKSKERYFTIAAGVGVINIHSKFNITLTDTADFGTFPPKQYEGNMFQIAPRLILGYQYEKIKASLYSFVMEDRLRTNLTALWIGATFSYEIPLRKRKSSMVKNK